MFVRGMGATVTGPAGTPLTVPDTSSSACVGGFDQYGQACQDWSALINDPAALAAAISGLYAPSNSPTPTTLSTTALLVIGGVVVALLLAMGGGRR